MSDHFHSFVDVARKLRRISPVFASLVIATRSNTKGDEMFCRCSSFTVSLQAILTAAVLVGVGRPIHAAEPKSFVSLLLGKVTMERHQQEVLFLCEAALDNATGGDLTVRTNFYSVFDGLWIVVTNQSGTTLLQQQSIQHQSPYSLSGRSLTLKTGITKGTLVFPVRNLPDDVRLVKVRLIGTLPASGYGRPLSSDTLDAAIPK